MKALPDNSCDSDIALNRNLPATQNNVSANYFDAFQFALTRFRSAGWEIPNIRDPIPTPISSILLITPFAKTSWEGRPG
jgi:hypothetical protein